MSGFCKRQEQRTFCSFLRFLNSPLYQWRGIIFNQIIQRQNLILRNIFCQLFFSWTDNIREISACKSQIKFLLVGGSVRCNPFQFPYYTQVFLLPLSPGIIFSCPAVLIHGIGTDNRMCCKSYRFIVFFKITLFP